MRRGVELNVGQLTGSAPGFAGGRMTRGMVTRRARRGLSLLEVLISMFVLLIGLLGVASLIPAGRFEILQGAKLDNASAIGRAAFRDLKVRGYLDGRSWIASGATNPVWYTGAGSYDPLRPWTIDGNPTASPAIAVDPLGCYAPAGPFDNKFPHAATGLALTRVTPASIANYAQADAIFRSGHDLRLDDPTGRDLPPAQQMMGSGAKRSSEGDYSWLATIVTDPNSSALTRPVTVSVAVFYKRDLSSAGAGESSVSVTSFPGLGIGGGEIVINNTSKPLRPGQWIMLAGQLTRSVPSPTITLNYFRWYRVVSAAPIDSGSQNVTLAGQDWNPSISNPTAFLFDHVIAVYEKNMRVVVSE